MIPESIKQHETLRDVLLALPPDSVLTSDQRQTVKACWKALNEYSYQFAVHAEVKVQRKNQTSCKAMEARFRKAAETALDLHALLEGITEGAAVAKTLKESGAAGKELRLAQENSALKT